MRSSANFGISLVAVGAAVLALSGCSEDVGSGAIRTQGMYANFSVVAEGEGSSEVVAVLRVGGDNGTFVVLEDEDELIASADGDSKTMQGFNDGTKYRSTFDTDAGGTAFQIAFERGEDDPAPDSEVTMPDGFSVSLADADGDAIQRGNEVAIEWDPAGSGDIDWEVNGDCIWKEDGTTSDDGSFTIQGNDVEVKSLDEGETCEVTVTLERNNSGSVDAAFEEGGKFIATQRRTVRFDSTPAPSEEGGSDSGSDMGAGGSN